MLEHADAIVSRYPKQVTFVGYRTGEIRPMTKADLEAVVTFANDLDPIDLLYLQINITERAVVETWAHNIETGRTFSVLVLEGDTVLAEATLLYNTTNWTRHFGEIRIQVAPRARRISLARLLAEEIEWFARQLKLRVLTAGMTLEQEAA